MKKIRYLCDDGKIEEKNGKKQNYMSSVENIENSETIF